jgi:hypothetical protein
VNRIAFLLAGAAAGACPPRRAPPTPVIARVAPAPARPIDDAWVAGATHVVLDDHHALVFGGGTTNAAIWDGTVLTKLPSMPGVRAGATATVLADGDVLVVGGVAGGTADPSDTAVVLATALRWSRARGFSAVASMASPRVGHTATLLPDGRVLVIGGERLDGGMSPIASAELFDPRRDAWVPAGELAVARQHHTAALLPDGRVVVIGGQVAGLGTTAAIEIWDSGRRFTPGGQLAASRLDAGVEVRSATQLIVSGGISIDPPGQGPPVRTELTEHHDEVVRLPPPASLP